MGWTDQDCIDAGYNNRMQLAWSLANKYNVNVAYVDILLANIDYLSEITSILQAESGPRQS